MGKKQKEMCIIFMFHLSQNYSCASIIVMLGVLLIISFFFNLTIGQRIRYLKLSMPHTLGTSLWSTLIKHHAFVGSGTSLGFHVVIPWL